ncbi:hypothetical protein QQF64_012851 [Cirrhinus molitorella]|uniref:Uncharacterized protein n=1 Tax=Cirrhinus molitorella TaxID=172907 RepID=A0ABR3LZ61_9TELE
MGGYKAHLVENVGVSQSSFSSRTSQSRHTADLRSSNVMERKHGNCAINSEFLISWEIMIQCVGRRSSFYETISALTHTHTHTHTEEQRSLIRKKKRERAILHRDAARLFYQALLLSVFAWLSQAALLQQ